MRKYKSEFVLLMLLASMIIPFIQGVPTLVYDEEQIDAYQMQRRVFYSPWSFQFYIFADYGDLNALFEPQVGYARSYDGDLWTVIDEWSGVHTPADTTWGYYDFYMEPNGTYGYYATINTFLPNPALTLQRFDVARTGQLTLNSSVWQVDGDMDSPNALGVSVVEASDQRVFIVAYSGANTLTLYCLNYTTRTVIFTLNVESILIDDGIANPSNVQIPFGGLDRLEDGRIAVTSLWGDINPRWKGYVSIYDGAGSAVGDFDSVTIFSDSADYGNAQRRTDTAPAGNIYHVIYSIRSGGNMLLNHREYNATAGSWSGATTINNTHPDNFGLSPQISATDEGNLTVFYQRQTGADDHWIYARRRFANGTWQDGFYQYNDAGWDFDWHQFTITEDYDSPIGITYQHDASDPNDIWFDFLGELDPLPFGFLNASSSNDDRWIFEGEVYELEVFLNNCQSGYFNFTDGKHQIQFHFNNVSRQTWIDVDPNDQFTIGLIHSEMDFYSGNITKVLWRFVPDRNIVDYNNTRLDYYIYNSFLGLNQSGATGIEFGIYNLGGFSSYNFTGEAGRITGGTTFEIWAENSSGGAYAYAETVYRKMQGVHLQFALDVEDGDCFDHHEQTGYVEMGIQFRYEGAWVTGWYYNLVIVNGAVDAAGGGLGKAWIIPSIDWYSRSIGGTVTNPVQDEISAYPECGDDVNADRTDVRFWVDLWFDRLNSSEIIGGRVSSYYYGMDEGGWMLWSNWNPVFLNATSSMYFDDLRLPDGNITDSTEIELVKFWVKVGKTGSGNPLGGDCDDHRWSLRRFEILNYHTAPDRMQGIDTPIFVDTKVVDMPQTGFLQPLYRAIDGLSRAIWMGALGFIKILWGAMDTIFEWAGFGEGFFSSITEFLLQLPQLFTTIMENMGRIIDGFVDVIEDTINMALAFMPQLLIGFGWLTETIIDYWGIIMGLFNGELLPFNIIEDIQLGDWLRFGFALLPTYEIFTIIFSNDPLKKLKERAEFWGMIFNGTLSFFRMLFQILSRIVEVIIGILPV